MRWRSSPSLMPSRGSFHAGGSSVPILRRRDGRPLGVWVFILALSVGHSCDSVGLTVLLTCLFLLFCRNHGARTTDPCWRSRQA